MENAVEEKPLTNRSVVWIGAKLGCTLMLLAFIYLLIRDVTNESYSNKVSFTIGLPIAAMGPGILLGIIGAFIGKYWRRTKLATEIGAVIGTVLGTATIGVFLGIVWLAITGNWVQ